MTKENLKTHIVKRPPVVVVMGHVDHGKSTLLDYIRKTNIVAGESGGITQYISAYEVTHKSQSKTNDNNDQNQSRVITFLDTPGHEAFSKMRNRGAKTADIAILVVSAEDGVKAQTMEANETIIKNKIPYIVAINKIDKANANVERVKNELSEKEIYLEGMGGDIPFVLISAKEGTGINELLDMVLLIADLQEFTGDTNINATGVVIESNREPKRGVSATCIIKNGTIKSGMFLACGTSIVPTRIMENFLGNPIKEATFSSPISIVGFDTMPKVGSIFESFKTKKEAETYVNLIKENEFLNKNIKKEEANKNTKIIYLVIKTDVSGSFEAIEKEIKKLNNEEVSFSIINSGVGPIGESDLKMASIDKDGITIGFNVKIENSARNLNESLKVNVQTFDIIYKLTDWLKKISEERRPRVEVLEVIGSLKIIKVFSSMKNKKVIGGKVISGKITVGSEVKIMRRDFEIGQGKIIELQQSKIKAKEVLENSDCGILIDSKVDISSGDVLEAFIITIK